MKRVILAGLVPLMLVGLSGCGLVRNTAGAVGFGSGSATRASAEIDGQRYRSRASATREDRRAFTVTVSPVTADPTAAIEVGRWQANRYCLLTFGGSDKDWLIGPETPPENLVVEDGKLVFTGRCTHR